MFDWFVETHRADGYRGSDVTVGRTKENIFLNCNWHEKAELETTFLNKHGNGAAQLGVIGREKKGP